MSKTRILIADDHNFIIDGIKSMLIEEKDLEVIGEAANGEEAIQKTKELEPDLIVMDISMPIISGIEATKIITQQFPNIKILALTQHDESEYIFQFIKAGGLGYLLKNSKKHEFLDAIETLMKGEKYFSSKISNLLMNNFLSAKEEEQNDPNKKIPLTRRELEIIKLIASDISNNEIADELNLSLRTVETHRRNIMQKLNMKSVVALVRYAIQNKLVNITED